MATPLYAVQNHLHSNWKLDDVSIRAIGNHGGFEQQIKENAIRVHQIELGLTWHGDDDLKDVPSLIEGMRVLGCADPEKLVKEIEPTFKREYIAPSGRELEW